MISSSSNGYVSCACWIALLLMAAGCEQSKQVASDCEGSACGASLSAGGKVCLASETRLTIDAAGDPPGLSGVCLAQPAEHDDDGKINCRVFYALGVFNPATMHCGDVDYLSKVNVTDNDDSFCQVRQVLPPSAGASQPTLSGWYYKANDPVCTRGYGSVAFSDDAAPGDRVRVQVLCESLTTSSGDELVAATPNECISPDVDDVSDVGKPCLPALLPTGGFTGDSVAVELGSEQCSTGVCLEDNFYGDPTAADAGADCEPAAGDGGVSSACAARRIFCSCRCDAPQGDPGPFCACPSGYVCDPRLDGAAPGQRGSYCVHAEDANQFSVGGS